MIKKIIFCFVLLSLTINFSYAQNEVILSGEADCKVSGKSPVKKFIADANRLLVLQNEGISKGSIQLQLISNTETNLIDINILALLGETENLEPFLNGKTINIESVDSTFKISNILKSSNVALEVSNTISGTQSHSFRTILKVKKTEDDLLNGILNIVLKKSTFVETTNAGSKSNTKNGKIVLRCKLKDIPLEIKELTF